MYKNAQYVVSMNGSRYIQVAIDGVIRLIPCDPNNSDYVNIKMALTGGLTLNDANGNPMTADQIAAFVATLP